MFFRPFSYRFPIAAILVFELFRPTIKIFRSGFLLQTKAIIIPYGLKYVWVHKIPSFSLFQAAQNPISVGKHPKWSEFYRNSDNSDGIIPMSLKK